MVASFHTLEITSRCNLRCHYCPQPKMLRDKKDMSREIFDRVLYWLEKFQQPDLHMHNFGESTLHPDLVEYVRDVKRFVPFVGLSSNGVGVKRELIVDLKKAGLSKLSISVHRPEAAQWTVEMCRDVGLPYDIASGAILNTHNWAGQVDAPVTMDVPFECHFLREQRAVVLSDGSVAACCIDAEGTSVHSTIWDDLTTVDHRPFPLCVNCHHIVPIDMFPNWREEVAKMTKA